MFEAYTYEHLMEDVIKNAPEGVDTRQGSIFYDSISAILMKIAKLYTDLDVVLNLGMLDTTSGEYLDLRSSEFGLDRQNATAACYFAEFEGATPKVGERFYTDGIYFVLRVDDLGVYYFECETKGTAGNNIYEGTAAIPVNNIPGLKSAKIGGIYSYGTDIETDTSLRKRVQEKIAGPAENGNKQHYKTWCESVDGVGTARIFPLWNGPNTVKGVLINSLGLPCDKTIVDKVQDYVDPATKGYTAVVNGVTYVVGDGLGEGVANLGAHFTASAAKSVEINISFTAELRGSVTSEELKRRTEEVMTEYFKSLVISASDETEVIVRISAVGAALTDIPYLIDYHNLLLNGEDSNINVGYEGVPVLSEVIANVL